MIDGLKKMAEIWKSARKFYDSQPQVDRKGNELEFLPAAVEILETPPSPMSRVVMFLLITLFTIAVLWAWFGKIDIEAVAQGRVIPVGQIKAVQALEMGKVEELLVEEGQAVEKDQPLIKLDPTEVEADVEQLQKDLLENQLNGYRLSLLMRYLDHADVNYLDYITHWNAEKPVLPVAATVEQLDLQQSLLNRDLETFRSTEGALAANLNRQKATIEATKAEIARLRILKPLFDEQEKSIKSLLDAGHISTIEWLNVKEKQVEITQGLSIQRNRLLEARASLQALASDGERQNKEFRSVRIQQLFEFRSKARTAELTLTKAMEKQENRYLLAPVDGTVQQLQIHTVGGVVQPAQPLMFIVPKGTELEVEAMVLNKDIGFIEMGQKVEIKVESFPYTRYGMLPGEVKSVSKDSVEQEQMGRVFPMRVHLAEKQILVKDQMVPIQPGMSVTVEVKIGKRRLLEFFLAPFLRYQDEGFKER